jgi:molecular chaperone GrpE
MTDEKKDNLHKPEKDDRKSEIMNIKRTEITKAKLKKVRNETLSQSDFDKTKQELETLKKERESLIFTAKQALADYQNYKRRVEEGKKDISFFALEGIMLELLPILDNFERALKFAPKEPKSFIDGVFHIQSQLKQSLEKRGLKEIKSLGEKLDPLRHQAIMQVPGEKDTIIEELEKGYTLEDKVIRAAKVKVGNGEK